MKHYQFRKSLKPKKYKKAIILPNSIKYTLIPFFTHISMKTGCIGEMRYDLLNDIRILNKKSFPLMIQHYITLAYNNKSIQHFSNFPNPLSIPKFKIKYNNNCILYKSHSDSYKKSLIGICSRIKFKLTKCWSSLSLHNINYKVNSFRIPCNHFSIYS